MHIRIALLVVVLFVVSACSDDDATGGTTAVASTASATSDAVGAITTAAPRPGDPVVPALLEHLDQTVVRVGGMDLLVVVARDSTDRERGLMDIADLGDLDGMLFDFGDDTSVDFWMFNVLIPLDIAWFDAQGGFVSATLMEPCVTETADGDDCERYDAAGRYRFALEVPAGNLEALGPAPMLDTTSIG